MGSAFSGAKPLLERKLFVSVQIAQLTLVPTAQTSAAAGVTKQNIRNPISICHSAEDVTGTGKLRNIKPPYVRDETGMVSWRLNEQETFQNIFLCQTSNGVNSP